MVRFLNSLIALVALTSCGYQQTLREHCRIGDTQTCDNLFGRNQSEVDEQQNAQLQGLSKEVESLSTMMSLMIKDLTEVESRIATNDSLILLANSMIQQQGADIQTLQNVVTQIESDNQDLEQKLDYQQGLINTIQVDLAKLVTQDGIKELHDPCGDKAGKYDEIIVVTTSGKLLAYFEDGGNRFLTLLGPGSYRTTDAQKCFFDINSAGKIVNERL